MNPYQQISNLSEIPSDKKYSGYYWMSDEREPKLVDGEFNPPLNGNNPFIIEANLYAKDEISVSIEHIDGKYLIGIVDWNLVDETTILESQTYLGRGLKEKSVCLAHAWIPVIDPECARMEVLQPAWRAFKGFVKVVNLNKD